MLDVQLTRQMQDWIERQVAAGAYADASEVVRAGLRTLIERDGTLDENRRQATLEASLIEGEASGPGEPFDAEAFLIERAA